MDSKYSIGSGSGSSKSGSNMTGLKRKFSYTSPTTVPPKKPNIQSTLRAITPSSKHSPVSSSGDRTISKDIQQQRKQLPVYAVKESYVYLTTNYFLFTISNFR